MAAIAKVPVCLNFNKKNYDRLEKESKKLGLSKTKIAELALDQLFENKKLKLIISKA